MNTALNRLAHTDTTIPHTVGNWDDLNTCRCIDNAAVDVYRSVSDLQMHARVMDPGSWQTREGRSMECVCNRRG